MQGGSLFEHRLWLAQDTLEGGDYFEGLPVTGNDVVMRLKSFEYAMRRMAFDSRRVI